MVVWVAGGSCVVCAAEGCLCCGGLVAWAGAGAGRRMVRFAPAAVAALAATAVVHFLCGSVWHLTGRVTGAAGWLAGAVVSYGVSRWAWERRGRPRLLRETVP